MAGRGDVGVVEVGATEESFQSGGVLGVSLVEGMGDEYCALAFSQIVPGRLAGEHGVTKDAEQVIAVLEGPPDGGAEIGHRLLEAI